MEIMGVSISENIIEILLPIVVYWSYSGFLTLFEPLENYRLHSKKDEDKKNLVSKGEVIRTVLLSQAIQSLLFIAQLYIFTGNDDVSSSNSTEGSLYSTAKQIVIAVVVYDTWMYFVHRYMHINKFLYRNFHSYHHRLTAPYAFGSMYTHPVEGLITDTCGGAVSFFFSGMSPRVSMFVFSLAIVKTINDHCGLVLPGNPFDLFMENSTAFHDSHHQLDGTKYNFSATYFVVWDKLLGTYRACSLEKKAGGGLKASFTKDCKGN